MARLRLKTSHHLQTPPWHSSEHSDQECSHVCLEHRQKEKAPQDKRPANRAKLVALTHEGKYTGLEKRKVSQNVRVNGAHTTTAWREGPCVARARAGSAGCQHLGPEVHSAAFTSSKLSIWTACREMSPQQRQDPLGLAAVPAL